MKINKILALGLALTMVMASALGCSSKPAKEEPAASGGEKKQLKVALMTSGPINDAGWAASAYAGLQMIEKDYSAEISYTESIKQSDFEEVYRNYATQGYNVIIGHGFEFGDSAMAVAPDFPDTTFICTSTDISQAPNVGSLNTLPSQMGFLQGVAAAYMTKSNVVGAIGGISIPPVVNALNGFAAGVKYVKPDVKVLLNMTGSFEDGAKCKEAAFAMINAGADVIMYDADQAGLGALEAIKEKNIWGISSIADQNSLAPDNMLLSGICDIPKALDLIVGKVVKGEFKPQFYPLGVNDGCVYTINNAKVFDTMSQEGKDALAKAEAGLKDGSIDEMKLISELAETVK